MRYEGNHHFFIEWKGSREKTLTYEIFKMKWIPTIYFYYNFRPLNPAIFTKDNVQEYLKAGDYFFIDSIR